MLLHIFTCPSPYKKQNSSVNICHNKLKMVASNSKLHVTSHENWLTKKAYSHTGEYPDHSLLEHAKILDEPITLEKDQHKLPQTMRNCTCPPMKTAIFPNHLGHPLTAPAVPFHCCQPVVAI
jgi:hypothetical protein